MRILYIEDEIYLATAVKFNLEKQGFQVDLAHDGETGLDLAVQDIYDVIVLDIMLPKCSGSDILSTLRARHINTPVLMLSALSEVDDKVRHLDLGADDYLAKPFKTAELVARLKALSRRPSEFQPSIINYLDLTYDTNEKTLNGIKLTAKEAAILEALLASPEKVVKKAYLINHVWGQDASPDDNYLEVYISRLRKVLASLGSQAKIAVVRHLGYKLTTEENHV